MNMDPKLDRELRNGAELKAYMREKKIRQKNLSEVTGRDTRTIRRWIESTDPPNKIAILGLLALQRGNLV